MIKTLPFYCDSHHTFKLTLPEKVQFTQINFIGEDGVPEITAVYDENDPVEERTYVLCTSIPADAPRVIQGIAMQCWLMGINLLQSQSFYVYEAPNPQDRS